ncbi:NACHT domain-containing protein [Arthrobacter sp. EPSL27]|uniref:NACHT domain-containing protein n=1 Tax=Arthrobacter sp. EPSL27 TaxID=1745378 RepID=UPI0018D2226E|nr:NACHT domain-containing protein [Arthrobacter sp. EPSL27]
MSYLMYLAHVAHSNEVQTEGSSSEVSSYAQAFEKELRAHLALEARIPDSELEQVTTVLTEVLRLSASAQARQENRSSIPRSADKPPALFLFSEAEARSELFRALGQPSLATYRDYSERYRRAMSSKYGYVSLQHLGQDAPPLELSSIYVEPTLTEAPNPATGIPRRIHDAPVQGGELTVRGAFTKSSRTVILGPAGVGKSTLVKHAVQMITTDESADPPIPFVLELKHYQSRTASDSGLFKEHIVRGITQMMQHPPPDGWIDYMLLTGRATIFFDGYDEVLNSADRALIRDAIINFARLYPASAVVVTTRIIGYAAIAFTPQEFLHVAVNDFQPDQVDRYAHKWFASRNLVDGAVDAETTSSFLSETEKYAPDLRANPLMLSLLCSVFYHQGDIPRTLAELYERCATLMFQQWSVMRGLEDPGVWRTDLRPALFHIASLILDDAEYRREGMPQGRLIQELQDFFQEQTTIAVDVAREQAQVLVNAWSGRAWVITEVGRDRSNQPRFGFVHQSFLEYFSAVHLARSSDNTEELFSKVRDRLIHMNGWSVAQIAVSLWNTYRAGGASKFGEVLLANVSVSSPRDALHLLMFCTSLRDFVDFTRTVDALFADAAIALYTDSIVEAFPGVNLSDLHTESRHVSDLIDEEAYEALDIGDFSRRMRLQDAAAMEADAQPPRTQLTTLQAEGVLNALVNFSIRSQAQFELLLHHAATVSTWPSKPAETFVAVAFLCHLIMERLVSTQEWTSEREDAVYDVLEKLYPRVGEAPTDWPAHAAAFASGLISRDAALALIPWNSALTRESVVLSYISDFDMDSAVTGDLVEDFVYGRSESRDTTLSAIGGSFLGDLERADDNHKQPWSGIPVTDAETMLGLRVPPGAPERLRPIYDRDWESEHVAGFFVLLAIAGELNGSFRSSYFDRTGLSPRVQAVLWLADTNAAMTSSTEAKYLSHIDYEPLRRAISWWRRRDISFTV